MTAPTYKLVITRGKTLDQPLLYAEGLLVYCPIEAQVSKAPVRLTLTDHGIPDGWPVRIQGVTTPIELNTPVDTAVLAHFVDSNTIELNSLDSNTWAEYVPPGSVVFNKPADLTGWKIRMQVRNKPGGTVLISLSSEPADGADGVITIDVAGSSFTLGLTAAQTESLSWNGGVFDVEGIRPDGKVVAMIATSVVQVVQEVTVWE